MKVPRCFQFIKDAADWDESIPSSRTGDYITIARKAKGKESWFLGAITDENARKKYIRLLTSGKSIKRLFMKMQRCGLENNLSLIK
jgi:hypothetical protein